MVDGYQKAEGPQERSQDYVFWAMRAKPIHWIILALMIKTKDKDIQDGRTREHDITLVRGDLAFCKVCKAGEGELTTECCGRRRSEEERNRVYKIGNLDFINGKWTKK